MQNNDYFKLESKFNETNSDLIKALDELKSIKDKGMSEYLKNNLSFEIEKKSL